ncbi:hypothetical protein [Streptomyces sp. NPDC059063]|uniref:hypothetical protein n=1 Tax=unclassified Streptomyces TaxID=2593676 RepID=UPI003691FB7A
MTQQSGQGAASSDPQQPSAREAREGIVLPADGSAPLMPGTTGDHGGHTAPLGGSPWGQPWGPDPAAPAPGAGEAWGTAAPHQGAPYQDPAASYQDPAAGAYQDPGAPYAQPTAPQPTAGVPLPPESTTPYPAQPQPPAAMPLPPEGTPLPPAAPPEASYGGPHGAAYGAAPLPPMAQSGQNAQSAPLPPAAQGGPHGQELPSAGQPGQPGLPGQPDTAYGAGHGGRHAAPAAGAPAAPATRSDADATQYIPPVAAPGALPPEVQAPDATTFLGRTPAPSEETAFLGRVPEETTFLGSASDVARGGVPDDNAPTQFIAPVTDGGAPANAPYGGVGPGAPGERQPPAEFDSLFRREPDDGGASSTQQMPRVPEPAPAPGPAAFAAEPVPARQRRRTGSKAPLLVAVGVAIAVLGVGAGALLSSGGDEKKDDDKEPLAATEPADKDDKESKKPSPSADPARPQAVALDKLLADSNDSRESVIRAVRDVGRCDNLRSAARDLRDAARQRNGLVGRLSGLSVDKLPKHAQLTAALNRAWKASASADNHYAAWADQVAGKKGCRKGHARPSPHQGAGNRASGEATKAKQQAAVLWNAIARKQELTTRNPTQL